MRTMIFKITSFLIVVGIALWLYFSNVGLMYEKKIGVEIAAFQEHSIPEQKFAP